MTAAAIEVDSLCKTYRDGWLGSRNIEALRDVSFAVEKGSIFGLLGPNGAGKTTLIKVLLGLVRKTAGNASLLGYVAGDRAGRREVGYLPENHRIPRHLTGNTALAYFGGLSNVPAAEIRRRRQDLMQRVGLERWGETSVRKYSKGMLQRLGLAQAMLHHPQLLILDEPTDGVDPVGRSELRAILRSLKEEGRTIFINSHLLQEVELLCDRAAILVQGRLRRVGMIEEITHHEQPHFEFSLAGTEEMIRAALTAAATEGTIFSENGRFRVDVVAPDQQKVNLCIDELRRRQIDILGLSRAKQSLEDAFINIVGNNEGKP